MAGRQVGLRRMERSEESQVMPLASATVGITRMMLLREGFIARHTATVMMMRHDYRNQHHQARQEQHVPDDLFLPLHNRLRQR